MHKKPHLLRHAHSHSGNGAWPHVDPTIDPPTTSFCRIEGQCTAIASDLHEWFKLFIELRLALELINAAIFNLQTRMKME